MKTLTGITVKSKQAGFTIVELLVATAVFSVVLVVITFGILQISRTYYKGITESTTQNTARSVIDLISQAIQFNGGGVTETVTSPAVGNPVAFCVGNQQFSYQLGKVYQEKPNTAKDETYHGITVRSLAGCGASSPADNVDKIVIAGQELLGPRMRIANLQVTNISPNVYRVTLRIVYGDADVINNPTAKTASCKGIRAGTQFCAVSELSTVVTKRVQ